MYHPGVTLYYNYTPCAFSLTIIDSYCGLHVLNPTPPIADRDKIYPHPIAGQGIEQVTPLQTYKNV
jgi:hypothetical protein